VLAAKKREEVDITIITLILDSSDEPFPLCGEQWVFYADMEMTLIPLRITLNSRQRNGVDGQQSGLEAKTTAVLLIHMLPEKRFHCFNIES
jgi:hypothetical protein